MGVAAYGYARQRFARHYENRNSVRFNLRCDEVASFMSGWMRRTEPHGTCWIVTWEDRAQGIGVRVDITYPLRVLRF